MEECFNGVVDHDLEFSGGPGEQENVVGPYQVVGLSPVKSETHVEELPFGDDGFEGVIDGVVEFFGCTGASLHAFLQLVIVRFPAPMAVCRFLSISGSSTSPTSVVDVLKA